MRVDTVARGILSINLDALADNYRLLTRMAAGSEVAGVVKANGYGLGAREVAACLRSAGCRSFFVAHAARASACAKAWRMPGSSCSTGSAKGPGRTSPMPG